MPFFLTMVILLRNILTIFVTNEGHFTTYFHSVC
jgi:hypothetical protein